LVPHEYQGSGCAQWGIPAIADTFEPAASQCPFGTPAFSCIDGFAHSIGSFAGFRSGGHVELPGKDEGALNYLRFPVVLNEAYPDLHAEMERTPVRLRAERLRALATLGLHAVAMAAEANRVRPL